MSIPKISAVDLANHATPTSSWIALNGTVWDVTSFLSQHPGGPEIILEHVGNDGSDAYNSIHGPGLVATFLDPSCRKGELDDASISFFKNQAEKGKEGEKEGPSLGLKSIINLRQFEAVAEQRMNDRTWAYVSGATENGSSHRLNQDIYSRILFRPRILAKVKDCDTSVSVLGQKYQLPFFNAPTSSVKLSHKDGELAIARASVAFGVPPIIPTLGSYSTDEIAGAMPDDYPFFFQLYMYSSREQTRKILEAASKYKSRAQGILFTVDLPVMSKREAPIRVRKGEEKKEIQAAPPPATGALEDNLNWEDVKWIREVTGLPVFPKGIQTWEDAKKAAEVGCEGIYLSNHGGRAVDTAVPAIITLLEIQRNCPEVLEKMEVFIDGGVWRGGDILKCICLGASMVGIGRPFLYSLSYGEEGARKAFEILREELQMAMQLVGITSLSQAHPGLLNTGDVDRLVYQGEGHPWAKKIVRKSLVKSRL